MITKRPDEEQFEYGLRLIEAKMEGVEDIEWQDIVDELGLDCHRDTLRKSCQAEYGSYNVLRHFRAKQEDALAEQTGVLDLLEMKRIEILKERKKRETINLEFNKMLREQARDELLVEKLRDIIPTLTVPEFKELQYNPSTKKWVLGFGDVHFDKFYESVNNEYSIEIVYDRFEKLLAKLIFEIKREGITHLDVLNVGDSLEGLLRISALRTMREGTLKSVVMFSRFMSEWLNKLSEYVEVTYRHVPTANHSEIRMWNQKRGETDENLELVIMNYIHDSLQHNPRIKVILPEKAYIDFEIFGFKNISMHGDGIKNLKTAIRDLSSLHRVFYDYLIVGHFHSKLIMTVNEAETNDVEVIVIPSMIGSDTYSDSLLTGSKASALLLGYTEGEGMTENRKLILN